MSTDFEFYRYRFHFRALDAVHLPLGKSANVVRGAFGNVLHDAVPAAVYSRFFEPGAKTAASPSGLADWPRPFVFRVAHLDGSTMAPGQAFYMDAHVFDLRASALDYFRSALALLADKGLGPGRGRAKLDATEQLDLDGAATAVADQAGPPNRIELSWNGDRCQSLKLRFETPTELKGDGVLADRPEFGILFRRLRDRLSTLRALYGCGPLDVDFQAMGERARAVRLVSSRLSWERVQRKSGRTGQVHSIGGFTGLAEYAGELAEFLPWLRAARWVGVGRQTVWGKGDVRIVESPYVADSAASNPKE